MVESCRVFSYSPNNIYASDYYNACRKFDKIRNDVIAYEHKTDDRESPEYKKMMVEFDYWNNKVPEISNIAGEYEDKLIMKRQEKNKEEEFAYNSNPISGTSKLDYYA